MKRPETRSKTQSRPAAPSSREADASGDARAVPFVLRAAQRDDIAAVTALDERVTGLVKPAHWLDLYERQKKAHPPAGIFLVAVEKHSTGTRLLGFIVGEIRAWEFGSAPCGWVYALSVEPESRQVRVGEALLEAMADEFRKAGVGKMRTMVTRDNLLPMLFFRGEGMMAGPYIQLEKDLG